MYVDILWCYCEEYSHAFLQFALQLIAINLCVSLNYSGLSVCSVIICLLSALYTRKRTAVT